MWLEWGNAQRENYVSAYVEGYLEGLEAGCQKGSKDSTDEEERLRKCRDETVDFSKGSAYFVATVTEFYKRFPKDRDIYPWEILEQLGRGQALEQIHEHPFMRHESGVAHQS
jgi:hypothetical protein